MPNLAASQNHRITGMVSGWTPPAAPSSVLLLTQGRQASKPTITQQLMSIGGDHMPKPTISPSALSLEGFSESSKSIPSPDIERLLALFCYARPYRSGRRHVNRGRDKTGTYIRWTSGDLDKRVELPLAINSSSSPKVYCAGDTVIIAIMSHGHPVIPITLARQMIAPDILRQVLVYVTTPTLTTCLRVCRDFYRVGAPLLYRHARFFNDAPSFQEGVDVVPKGIATRSGPRVENLKAVLYRYIRTVSITSPESPYIDKSWLGEVIDEVTMFPMPQLETVRIRYFNAPLESAACRPCWAHYDRDYGCEYGSSLTHYLLMNFAARKLVFLHYQGPPVHPSHRRLIELEPVETLTLVIYPDCFTDLLALAMGRMHWIHLPTFRIIFCSFDQEDLWAFRSERHMSPEDTFIHMVFCATYDTYSRSAEIYLIGDVMPQTPEARRGKLLLSKAREAELFDTYAALRYEELRTPMSERAKVVFKDRRDYLEEGVMDEIDAEELARWKEAQDRQDVEDCEYAQDCEDAQDRGVQADFSDQ